MTFWSRSTDIVFSCKTYSINLCFIYNFKKYYTVQSRHNGFLILWSFFHYDFHNLTSGPTNPRAGPVCVCKKVWTFPDLLGSSYAMLPDRPISKSSMWRQSAKRWRWRAQTLSDWPCRQTQRKWTDHCIQEEQWKALNRLQQNRFTLTGFPLQFKCSLWPVSVMDSNLNFDLLVQRNMSSHKTCQQSCPSYTSPKIKSEKRK